MADPFGSICVVTDALWLSQQAKANCGAHPTSSGQNLRWVIALNELDVQTWP